MLISQEIFVIWPKGSKQVIDRVRFTTSINLAFALVAPEGKMEIRPAMVRNLEAEPLFDGVFETDEDLSVIVGPPIHHNPNIILNPEKEKAELSKSRKETPNLNIMITEFCGQKEQLCDRINSLSKVVEVTVGYQAGFPALDQRPGGSMMEVMDGMLSDMIVLNNRLGELVEVLSAKLVG